MPKSSRLDARAASSLTSRATRRPFSLELEALECRRVFSTDFAFAGLEYRDGDTLPTIVFGEGTRADNGDITGTTNRVSFANGLTTGGIDISSMTFNNDGTMGLSFNDLVSVLNSSGSDFRTSGGYSNGYFSGQAPQVTSNTFDGEFSRYFLEQLAGVRRWDSPYANTADPEFNQFQAMVITETGTQMVTGLIQFTYPQDNNQLDPFPPIGATITLGDTVLNRTVESIDPDGTIHFTTGDFLIVSSNRDPIAPDGSTASGRTATSMIYIDPDATDGNLVLAVGARHMVEPFIDNTASAGIYRGVFQINSALAADFLGRDLQQSVNLSASVVLQLSSDGTYKLWDAIAYANEQDPVSTGNWRIMQTYYPFQTSTGTLQLVETGTNMSALFLINDDGSFNARWVVAADGETHETLMGELATHIQPWQFSGGIVRSVTIDSNGRPQAYLFRQDSLDGFADRWSHVDLINAAGGQPLVFAYTAGGEDQIYAINVNTLLSAPNVIMGVDINGKAVAYELLVNGKWILHDLSAELLGGRTVVSDFAAAPMSANYYRYNAQNVYVNSFTYNAPLFTGVTSDAHRVLLYPWSNIGDTFRNTYFSTIDITQVIADNSLTDPGFMPDSVTPLATGWGMVSVVGLDSSGHVKSIWTSPGSGWFANDLTSDSSGPALAGKLSTLAGSTDLDIFGRDQTQNLIQMHVGGSTGWFWQSSNLTALTSGPVIPTNLISFHWHDSQDLTAAGGVDGAGNSIVYWRGQIANEPWKIADLSASIAAEDRPVSLTSADSLLEYTGLNQSGTPTVATQIHIYGTNADNDIVRLVWEQGVDLWRLENITDSAVTVA